MQTSVNLATLPEISFLPQSAVEVEATILTTYERIARVTLQPGDPVRLFLESLAYYIIIQNGLIDTAGKQNLLAYATSGHLDHLGALMGVARIPAQPSRCLLTFSIGSALDFEVPVPAGTRVSTQDGRIIFATAQMAVIEPGDLSATAVAFSVTAGQNCNGLVPGQISQLVDPLPYIVSSVNSSLTMAGADVESDDRLRERIRIAPESFTVAGSRGAYEARTLAVSQEIEEVSVWSPEPGVVDVRFTLTGGELPDAAIIAMVEEGLSDETVRPLTDMVMVGAPDPVPYSIRGQWFLRRADAPLLGSVSLAVAKALETFRLWQRAKPGRDINPSKLISLVEQAGVKRVELAEPLFTPLTAIEIAREVEIALNFGGMEDD